jgi:hypothetical protein
MSNKKPKSISLKPAGKGKPCDVVINGDLIVKKDVVAQCDVTVKKCLKVKNIVYNSETIDESGETLSNDKTLSWINTNGNGVLNDATKEGFYKKVVKVNSAGGFIGWQSIQLNSDGITGVFGNTNINAIAFDSKENIYIGGNFTGVAGNTLLNGLAKWDVNAQSWTSVNGVNDIVQYDISSRAIQEIAIDSKDNVYIGGGFTSVAGNTLLNALAKWNGSSWTSVNGIGDGITAGVDPYVSAIDFDKNNENTIYIGGAFTEVAGNSNLKYLAKWDGSSWTSVNSSSDGVNSIVYTIDFDSNNNVYIGGFFTIVDNPPNFNLQFLAKWDDDNKSWTSVNSSDDNINSFLNEVTLDSSDNVYIGGAFTVLDNPPNFNLQFLAKYQQNLDTYKLFFNSGTSVELTNKGDNACFIYNEFLNEWIKL